ncbi:hypothetical protein Nepgr_020752 [Nepenthes gracilis]|uniref:Cyclin N-terminal domain-containing protein n=1 Tax=Nepenthes gracilis TaxID=150966 RepID=A0AAD3SXU9_NEPGR|nr:hypothetical protein Nepgr_020752 [Nepenthes gracilis]
MVPLREELEFTPPVRRSVVEFLIQSADNLEFRPIIKYSALSLFADRFYPSLSNSTRIHHWLLKPIRESNLQLFAIISLWISSKFHDSHPLSVEYLKAYADNRIKDQHFTKRDFLDAEVLFMQVLNFEIGTSTTAFAFLEDLLTEFKKTARVGELVSFDAAMDILDLLYETDEVLDRSVGCSVALAAAIMVASYVITAPKQRPEFPALPWLKFVTSCREEEIAPIVREILQHVIAPSGRKSFSWARI